jgi:hypothetical protein
LPTNNQLTTAMRPCQRASAALDSCSS